MSSFLNDKKRNFLDKEFDKLKHKVDEDNELHDEEFRRLKDRKKGLEPEDSNIINGVNINDIADINPNDDLPITEKKTKLSKFKQ